MTHIQHYLDRILGHLVAPDQQSPAQIRSVLETLRTEAYSEGYEDGSTDEARADE
jgi:hypothetical protein